MNHLADHLNATPAAETVCFGLDGASYEIDLTAVNAQQLRAELKPYTSAARLTRDTNSPRANF